MNTATQISVALTFACGIALMLVAFFWLSIQAIEMGARAFRVKKVLCEYIWHREDFKKWLKENCSDPTPAANGPDATTER